MSSSTSVTPPMQPKGAPPVNTPTEALGQNIVTVAARNSAFVLGAQVMIKVMALLFNVYVVRKLGAVHFGQYSAVMAYVTIFSVFTDLGMAPYSVREIAEDHRRTSWLLPNVVVIRMLLSLVITCIAPLSAYWLGKDHDMVLGILIASAGLLVYAIQGPLDSVLTARERLDYTAAFSVMNQLVFWGLGCLLLLSGMGFIGLILASSAGVGVIALLSCWALFGRMKVRQLTFSIRHWPGILRSALPFGISSLAGVFLRRFDTVLMTFVLTDAAVGWYNVPYTLINMVLLIAQSIAIAMYPSMVRGYNANPESLQSMIRRSVKYLLLVCLPIAVGGTILADQIIITLYTDEFVNSVPVLQLMLWALPSLFLLELLGRVANTLHLEGPAAKISIINAGITVLLNLTLIPTLGLTGGALAWVTGRAIRLGQFWFLIGNDRLIGRDWGPLFRVALATALMGVAVFFLQDTNLLLCIGGGAAVYAALILALGAIEPKELQFLWGLLLQRGQARA